LLGIDSSVELYMRMSLFSSRLIVSLQAYCPGIACVYIVTIVSGDDCAETKAFVKLLVDREHCQSEYLNALLKSVSYHRQ